jgi:hypothetical protein
MDSQFSPDDRLGMNILMKIYFFRRFVASEDPVRSLAPEQATPPLLCLGRLRDGIQPAEADRLDVHRALAGTPSFGLGGIGHNRREDRQGHEPPRDRAQLLGP